MITAIKSAMKQRRRADGQKVWMSRSEVACLLDVAPVMIGRWASEG